MARSKVDSSDFLKFMENEEDSHAVPFSSNPKITGNESVTSNSKVTNKSEQALANKKTSNTKITSNNKITGNQEVTGNSKITSGSKITSNDSVTSKSKITSNQASNLTSKAVTGNSKITGNQDSNRKQVTEELPAKSSNYNSNELVIEIPNQTHFLTLSGLQRKIVAVIFNLVRSKPDLTTDSISIEHLSDLLGREHSRNEIEVLKKTIIKLQHKGFLEKKSFKVGRGGHTAYSLNPTVFYQCSQTFGLENSNSLVTQQVTTPVTFGPSKKVSNLKDYNYLLTEELKSIGLNSRHLESVDRPEDEIEQIITHFTHSLKNNEVKSSSKLAVVLSVLKDPAKQWISESYLKSFEDELRRNQDRIQRLEDQRKQLAEIQLREKFGTYLKNNPGFLEEVAAKHSFVKNNPSLVEKMAFEEFKSKPEEPSL